MTSPSPFLCNTYYHIYNRGVNGEDIFVEERNYDLFLRLFEKHLILVVDLFAYCLLKNHFHVSMRVKSEEEILEAKKTQGFLLQARLSQSKQIPPNARIIPRASGWLRVKPVLVDTF